jgi:hypothetical protein
MEIPVVPFEKISTLCWVCDKPDALVCSGCAAAQYCSRECQGKDWRRHREVCKTKAHHHVAKRVFETSGRRVALEVIDGMGRGLVAKQNFSPGDVLINDTDALLISRYDIEAVMDLHTTIRRSSLHDAHLLDVPWSVEDEDEDEDGRRLVFDDEVQQALGLSEYTNTLLQHAWNRGRQAFPFTMSSSMEEVHLLRMQSEMRERLSDVKDPKRIMLEIVTQPEERAKCLLQHAPIRDIVRSYVRLASTLASNSLETGCGSASHQLEVLSLPIAMANHDRLHQNAIVWVCAPPLSSKDAHPPQTVAALLHACVPILKNEQVFITYRTLSHTPGPEEIKAYNEYLELMDIPPEPGTEGNPHFLPPRPRPAAAATTRFRYYTAPISVWLYDLQDSADASAAALAESWARW